MAGESDVDRLVEEARAAYQGRQYDVAYATLTEAASRTELAPDDVELLADAAWWVGRIADVLSLTESLHQRFLAEGNIDRAALQAIGMAGNLLMRGEHAPAMGWLSRGQRLLEGRPPSKAAGMLTYFAVGEALASQELEVAAEHAATLQQLGRDLGDSTFTAMGMLSAGLVELRKGRLAEGFALLDEAMLPVLAGHVAPDWAGNLYCTMISTCIELADFSRAREWATATERWLAELSVAVMYAGVCRAHRVELYCAEGVLESAEQEATKVVRELAELNAGACAEAEYFHGEALRLRGDTAGSRNRYSRAAALGRSPQPGSALLALAEGDTSGAWSAICAAVAEAGPDPFPCVRLLRAQVWIGLRTGHVDSAEAAVRRLAELSATYPTQGYRTWADEAAGLLALAQGRDHEAATLLAKASGGLRQIGAPHDAAVTDRMLAEAQRRLGDHVAARAADDAADGVFARLGTVDPTAARTDLPGGLTAREVEVLTAVATGVSNREAASSLHISEATLRRHLANIYTKLDVSSRTAAAAWAHDQGLT